MTDLSSSQQRREARAWKAKKDDDRARAAYRATLPMGIAALAALLETAESPWHAEVISARMRRVREFNRRKNEKRRDRTPEELARAQANAFPDGHKQCNECGQRLPLSRFDIDRSATHATHRYCQPCRAERRAQKETP